MLSEMELLQFLTPNLCGQRSTFGGRVKISHYIQPNNLSSALQEYIPSQIAMYVLQISKLENENYVPSKLDTNP